MANGGRVNRFADRQNEETIIVGVYRRLKRARRTWKHNPLLIHLVNLVLA